MEDKPLSKSAKRRRNRRNRKEQQQKDNEHTQPIDIFNPPDDDLEYMNWEYEFVMGED